MGRSETRTTSPLVEEVVGITIGEQYVDPEYPHTSNIGYLQIFQEVRNAFMDARGINLKTLGSQGLIPFTVGLTAEYRGQSKPGDVVDIRTSVDYDRRRIFFGQQMERGGAVVATVRCTYLLINDRGRPQVIPQSLIDSFRQPHA